MRTTKDQQLETQVAAILFKHDPADLARSGVPEDEYLGEARGIIREIAGQERLPAPSIIAALAYNVFRHSFGFARIGDSDELVDLGDEQAHGIIGTPDDFCVIGEELHQLFGENRCTSS